MHGIAFHTDRALFEACGVRVAFTETGGGVSRGDYEGLNLASHVGDVDACVKRNRQLALSALGFAGPVEAILNPHQVHGDEVFVVRDASDDTSPILEGCDAICCTAPDIPVLLCYADCVPVIIVAPDGSFTVVHSGWKGSIVAIAGKAVRTLAAESGCDPQTMNAYIGPHIRACCYQTSPEIMERFRERVGTEVDKGDGYLSLSCAVRCALFEAGIMETRVAELTCCTAESDRFYSYRASDGRCGRHGALAFRI